MSLPKSKTLMALAALVILAAPLAAQDPAKPPPPPKMPVKVDVVLSRYEGDKKISSLPFSLWVNANDVQSNLRMGMDVAIPSTADGKLVVNYRNIGTSIDCSVSSVDAGRFQLNLSVQDSSIYNPDLGPGAGAKTGGVSGYPTFRNFNSGNRLILRDGQSAQYVMATDKISGEVLKVDVTITVIK
jgi:hypothetical protein